MPTTVNGYHLWQLPEASAKEPSMRIGFSELENDLGNGYYAQALYGSATGQRKWRLRMPTLASFGIISAGLNGVDGSTVSREQYVWNLFCYTKVTGRPFVYTDPRTGQYYLVTFADKELDYQALKVKLYATGLELKQVRKEGVTVFDLNAAILYADDFPAYQFNEAGHDSPDWDDEQENAAIEGSGDVIYGAATQNGKDIVRLNSVSTDGELAVDLGAGIWREVFIVMKVREAAFGQNGVLIAENLEVATGETTFTPYLTPPANMEYRLNGVLYPNENMAAPMNAFGIVHLRVPGGIAGPSFVLGADIEADYAEIIGTSGLFPLDVAYEITEHLQVKWSVGG